jgi:signal transduction histidine kinase
VRAPRSLRRRIVLGFTVFGLCLALLSAGTLAAVFLTTEDAVQVRQLEVEVTHLLERGLPPGQSVVPIGRFMTAYSGIDAVPEAVRQRVAGFGEGIHEIGGFGDPETGLEYQVAVAQLPGGDGFVYVLFDVSALETARGSAPIIAVALVAAVVFITAAGALIGWSLAGTVIHPLADLARLVQRTPPEDLPESIRPEAYSEEVGVLARALRGAAVRVRDFVARERSFTSSANHELRTPITVVKGAAELLAAHPSSSDPGLRAPIERIERAVLQMEDTVELLLLLAREEDGLPQTDVPLHDLVRDVLDRNRGVTGDRPVSLQIEIEPEERVTANETALAIVLDNLVSNALARTESGQVRVSFSNGTLSVEDTGPGIPAELLSRVVEAHVKDQRSTGQGLGLSIVRNVCGRFGWKLTLDSREGEGTRAVLELAPQS